MNKNIKKLMMSELSFILFSSSFNDEMKLTAATELKKRLSNTSCSYDTFIKYEYNAFTRRNDNINNFLFNKDVNAQKLFELYFKSCLPNYSLHDNLMHSESHLINLFGYSIFFNKVLSIEIKKLKKRMERSEEIKQLSEVKEILENQLNFLRFNVFFENTSTDFIYDICPKNFNIYEFFGNIKLDGKNKTKDKMLRGFLDFIYVLDESTLIKNIAIHSFIFSDKLKTTKLKRKILYSLKREEINYNFINDELIQNIKKIHEK